MDDLLKEARTALQEPDSGNPTAAAFVDENLVRALSLRYRVLTHPEEEAALERAMLEEWRSGYVLERFFWEQLAAFERWRDGGVKPSKPASQRRLGCERAGIS
jgi:hypothetical protein